MTRKDEQSNSKKSAHTQTNYSGGQPTPLSGSHKVKNRNHSRQKHNSSHDM